MLRFPNQIEIRAITEYIKFMKVEKIPRNLMIFTDSQAAIHPSNAFEFCKVSDKDVINVFSTESNFEIKCFTGHCNIALNLMADELAREGSSPFEVLIIFIT